MGNKRKKWLIKIAGSLLVLVYMLHLAGLTHLNDYVLIAASIIAGYPIMKKALQSVRMKAFSIELLVTIEQKLATHSPSKSVI